MTAVAHELARMRGNEIAAREHAVASAVFSALDYQPPTVDSPAIERARPFVRFCADQGVSHLPARCETVAAFLVSLYELVSSADRVLEILEAVEAMHDARSLPSPVRGSIVGAALARWSFRIEAPRSWPTADKFMFQTLPLLAQHAIARREDQRDREMRRVHALAAQQKAG